MTRKTLQHLIEALDPKVESAAKKAGAALTQARAAVKDLVRENAVYEKALLDAFKAAGGPDDLKVLKSVVSTWGDPSLQLTHLLQITPVYGGRDEPSAAELIRRGMEKRARLS